MNDRIRTEVIQLINEAFEFIVLPHIIRIDRNIAEVKEELDLLRTEVRTGFAKIEKSLDDHEQRISNSEQRKLVA